jgi:predicted dehydrogenase
MKKSAANIGFIGAGSFISATHLRNAAISKYSRVHAICDLNETLLSEHNLKYKPQYITPDYHKILSDPEIDIVVIGTKQDLHAGLAMAALEAGKWVLVEKPLGETVEEMKLVIESEKRAPGYLAVGHNRRFAPAVTKAIKLLRNLPGPCFFNYRVMAPDLDKQIGRDANFYANRPNLVYEGCHMFDLANFIIGSYPIAVLASGDMYRSNCVICEYDDGSRFQFMLCSKGSLLMEKEYMEFFKDYAAISIRDFSDVRVRGIPGQFDELLPRQGGVFEKELQKYGADLLDELMAKVMDDLLKYDKLGEGWGRLPGEKVKRIGCNADIEAILREFRKSNENPFDVMMRCSADKGWFQSFEHFAVSFLNGKKPLNANANDGTMACIMAMAALESVKNGERIDIKTFGSNFKLSYKTMQDAVKV